MKAATVADTSTIQDHGQQLETPGKASIRAATPIWSQSPWKWFFSLGLGVAVLVALMIASIIGTMIDPLPRAQALIFYTWWYKLLLLALAVIMTCATVKTILVKLVPTYTIHIRPQKHFFETAPLTMKVPFKGTIEEVARVFRRRGFAVRKEGNAGAARTGWFGRFGAPVSHAGMVIVLLAGFASSWVAMEGIVQIPEGRTASSMQRSDNLEEIMPLGFTITVEDFSTGFFPRTRIPSHYTSTITAREGQKVLYSGPVEVNHSPKIKGWRLHQTSYQELPNLPRYEVEISGAGLSEPYKAKVSPGQTIALPTAEPLELTVDNRMNWVVASRNERLATGALTPGSAHGAQLALVANQFEPDFVLGENRTITSRSEELNNPALHVTLLRDGAPSISQWLFGREDMRAFSHAPDGVLRMELVDIQREESGNLFVVAVSDSSSGMVIARALLALGQEQVIQDDPHANCPDCAGAVAAAAGNGSDWNVKLGDRVTAYATVLTLTRNPAIPTIYFGCILMMVGLIMAFFVPRRDVWFLHDREKGVLSVAANYRHPSDTFDRTTRSVLAQLAKAGSSDSHIKER